MAATFNFRRMFGRPTLALLGIIAASVPAHTQVLISDSLIATFTIEELEDEGIADPENAIAAYKLVYNTVDPFGQPTIASGAVVIPVGTDCTHSIAAYMHGTVLDREGVPSRLSGEMLVAYYLSAFRYVSVLPDYLGLGDSPGPHPYMHAASEASAAVDMLRAAREFCEAMDVDLNGQLFLTGYSQGGHVCMATHRLIEQQLSQEFAVTASAPCSGPYDASGVQAQAITAEVPYPAPYYLPYVLFSYKHVYPWLYDDVQEVVLEPWATLLPPLFQGNNGSGAVDAIMPEVPNDILVPAMFDAFLTDPDHPFREALRDNDLYDWAPQARLRMFYCDADDHVFHENSLVTVQAMQANGAPDVLAINAGSGLDHNGCAFPALLAVKSVFDALQLPCNGVGVDEIANTALAVFPNPAIDEIQLRGVPDSATPVDWRLIAVDGRSCARGVLHSSGGAAVVQVDDLPAGAYVLELPNDGQAVRAQVVIAR